MSDFTTHRLTFPDDPLPAFVLVADDLPEGRMGAVASLGARLGIGVVSVGPQSRGISQVHLTVETGGEVVDGVSGGGGQGACPRQAPAPRAHLHPRLVRSGRQVILHLSPGAPKKVFWDLYHALRAITSSV